MRVTKVAALLLIAAFLASLCTGAIAATITYNSSTSSSSYESAGDAAPKKSSSSTGTATTTTAVSQTTLLPVTRIFFVRFWGALIPVRRTFLLPVTSTSARPAP